ncbi:hypothetical protein N7510_005539 [Penicillium lagena]|uniref:uncharacterized protein n=1 Tax=Penicillium lagena TaxID=94218 RepID=UPI0025404236|nr:uncharacterized protein N7510_005539 [Penicillium lagena]KAJ5612345.1 hypothetical protein N7510_005539 [Penicillium lagena]
MPSDSEGGFTRDQHLQTVFRVSVPKKKQPSVYHRRRTHQKSRTGCLVCKKRRIKVWAKQITEVLDSAMNKSHIVRDVRPGVFHAATPRN